MKKLALLILLGAVPVLAAPAPNGKPADNGSLTAVRSAEPPPEHPVTAAQVREILALTRTDTMRQQMLDGMLPSLREMMPYLPADVVADFRQSLAIADFQGAMVRSFQEHLSTEDAAEIIAFYKSPAGKHMIAVMPRVLDEGQQAGSDLGQQVMFEVIQRHRDEIDAAAKTYHEAHPQPQQPAH